MPNRPSAPAQSVGKREPKAFAADNPIFATTDPQSNEVAKQIHEQLLSETQEALLSDNFDAYAACFDLPFQLASFSGTQIIADETDLRSVFTTVRARIVQNNITDYVRNCITAKFIDETSIRATHETRLLSGVQLIGPATPGISLLKYVDGAWKVSDQQYAHDLKFKMSER